jgi:hypothetical protein
MAKADSFLRSNLSWSTTMDDVFVAEVIKLVNDDPRKSYSDFGVHSSLCGWREMCTIRACEKSLGFSEAGDFRRIGSWMIGLSGG